MAKHKLDRRFFKSGFTLIELIVVASVIVVVSTISFFSYRNSVISANDSSVKADVAKMNDAQILYLTNNRGSSGYQYFSGSGYDSTIDYRVSGDDVIDVNTNGTDYCIRGYNSNSNYNSITNAYEKGSSATACDNIGPSFYAIGVTAPATPTVTAVISNGYAVATISAVTCPYGTTPQYAIQSKINSGAWSGYSTWGTARTSGNSPFSIAASNDTLYSFQGQARCYYSQSLSSNPSTSTVASTYIPINTPSAPVPTIAINSPSTGMTTWSWPAVTCPNGGAIRYQYDEFFGGTSLLGWQATSATTLSFTTSTVGTFTVYVQAQCYGNYSSSAWSSSGSAPVSVYTLTLAAGANGSINPAKSSIPTIGGTVVTSTATPNTGYSFASWTTNSGSTCSNTATTTVTVTANTSCTANFSIQSFTVAATTSPADVASLWGSTLGTYAYGSTITLTVSSVAAGYTFSHWSGDTNCNNITANPYSFTLGAANVTCVANFFTIPTMSAVSAPTTASPTPTLTRWSWTAVSCVTGTVEYRYDEYFNGVDATGWSAAVTTPLYVDFTTTAAGTYTVYLQARCKVAAVNTYSSWSNSSSFSVTVYSLTFAANAGGTISSGAGLSNLYYANTVVSYTATANTGYSVSSMTTAGSACGTVPYVAYPSAPASYAGSVTVTANTTCTANFAINTYAVTFTVSPVSSGTLTGTANGVAFTSGATTPQYNQTINLQAANAAGYTFDYWGCTGTGTAVTTSNPYSFTLGAGAATCTAYFFTNRTATAITRTSTNATPGSGSSTFTWTAATACPTPLGSSVVSNIYRWQLVTNGVGGAWTETTGLTTGALTTNVAGSNYTANVQFGCKDTTLGTYSTWVAGTAPATITAYTLTISAGANGSVNSAAVNGTYLNGFTASITATASSSPSPYSVAGWSTTTCGPASVFTGLPGSQGTTDTRTVTFAGADITCSASFVLNSYAITLTASPASSSTFTINGVAGASANVAFGSTISISAAAAAAYTFSYWNCSGGIVVTSTSNPYTFVSSMPAAAITCTGYAFTNPIATTVTRTSTNATPGSGSSTWNWTAPTTLCPYGTNNYQWQLVTGGVAGAWNATTGLTTGAQTTNVANTSYTVNVQFRCSETTYGTSSSWISAVQPATITAYQLTAVANANGSINSATVNGTYLSGFTASVVSTANNGYWVSSLASTNATCNTSYTTTYPTAGSTSITVTLTITAATTCTASFTNAWYAVTTSISPSTLAGTITAPTNGTYLGTINFSTTVNAGYTFSYWSCTGIPSSTLNPYSYSPMPASGVSCTAYFFTNPTMSTVTANINSSATGTGAGTATPTYNSTNYTWPAVACTFAGNTTTATAIYTSQLVVTGANPSTGVAADTTNLYDSEVTNQAGNTYTMNVQARCTYTPPGLTQTYSAANYSTKSAASVSYTFSTSANANGTVSPVYTNQPVLSGTAISSTGTLLTATTATPNYGYGLATTLWTSTGSVCTAGTNPTTVTVTANTSCVANFTPHVLAFTQNTTTCTNTANTVGTCTADTGPGTISGGTAAGNVNFGTTITLNAPASSTNYTFINWTCKYSSDAAYTVYSTSTNYSFVIATDGTSLDCKANYFKTYALVAAGAVSQGAASAAVTPAWGAVVGANHLVVAVTTVTQSATVPATPTGWTLAISKLGTLTASAIFYKISVASETAPTFTAITSGVIAAQLYEFTYASTPALDSTGSAAGTTSPQTATNLTTSVANKGQLIITAVAAGYGNSRTTTNPGSAINNALETIYNNAATSTAAHYEFSWGITTQNTATDSNTFSFTTTQISGVASTIATFRF